MIPNILKSFASTADSLERSQIEYRPYRLPKDKSLQVVEVGAAGFRPTASPCLAIDQDAGI